MPKAIIEISLMQENETVEIIAENNQIIIKKAEPMRTHKTLKQRLEEFYGKDIEIILKEAEENIDDKFEEWDTGEPVGNEVF